MDKKEEIALLIEEFANSGKTQEEFSASKGRGVHKFNYWSRKLTMEKEESGFCQGGNRQRVFRGRRTAGTGISQRRETENLLSRLSRLIRLYWCSAWAPLTAITSTVPRWV